MDAGSGSGVGGRPPLVPVLAEDEELRSPLQHLGAEHVQVAHGDGLTGRSAGDDRHRADHSGQREQRLVSLRVNTCGLRILDHWGERAVEVETDHGRTQHVEDGRVGRTGIIGGELHGH